MILALAAIKLLNLKLAQAAEAEIAVHWKEESFILPVTKIYRPGEFD